MPVAASANIRKKATLHLGLTPKTSISLQTSNTSQKGHLRAHCEAILPVLIFKSCLTTKTCDQKELKSVRDQI